MTHTCSRPNLQAVQKIVLNIATTRSNAGFRGLNMLSHSTSGSGGLKKEHKGGRRRPKALHQTCEGLSEH